MSESLPPFPEPRSVALMSPEKARDIARTLRWLSDSYAEAEMEPQSRRAFRESEWWLQYSLVLAQRPSEPKQ